MASWRLLWSSSLLTLTLLSSAPAHAADGPPISEQARRNFRVGVSMLEDPDGARYEEAYTAFKAAYQDSPSPKILGNLALCAMKLERDSEAIDAYARYLREAPGITPTERAQIERDLTMLRANVAMLTLSVNAGRFTVVDHRVRPGSTPVINTYEGTGGKVELGLRAGHHSLTIQSPGRVNQTLELDLGPASRDLRAVALPTMPGTALPEAPPPRPKPSLVGPLVVSGTAVALLAAGTVTGIVAVNKTNSIQDSCPRNVCPAGYDLADHRSSAKRMVHVTDGLLLGGAVLGVAGITWLTLQLTGNREPERAPQQARRFEGGAMCTTQGCAGELKVAF